MISTESFEFFVQFDPRAATYGADGLCYRKDNIDGSTHGRDICENANGQERLRKNYSKLINYLRCTDDIAAKLFQDGNILTCQLETIQTETNKIRKNELLLNIIQHSGTNVFDRFITALLETNQSCIIRLLEDGIDFSLDHVKIIQENYIFIVENVDPMSGLLDRMFQLHSLTNRELEETLSSITTYKKNQELVSLLMRKSYECFLHFIEALEITNQKHIAEKLKRTNEAIRSNADSSSNNNTNLSTHQSSHDPSKKDQSVRRLMDMIEKDFCTLPGYVQMCVSLKIINKVSNSNEGSHMLFLRQTIETLNKEFNRGNEAFSQKERNLFSELNGEKQRNKELLKTISETKEKFRRIEAEKDLIKNDRDLNRIEKQQCDAELKKLKKELEYNRKELEKQVKHGKCENERLLLRISKSEEENHKIRHSRDLIANENSKISAELENLRKQLDLDRRGDEELKQIILRIKTEKEIIIADRDKMVIEKSRLSAELDELRNQLIQCELNIEQLNEKLSSIALEKLRVKENQDSISKENSQLSAELETMRIQLGIHRMKEEERDFAAKQGTDQLLRKISDIAEENKEMKGNLDLMETERNKLSAELDELKRQFEICRLEKQAREGDILQNRSKSIHCKICDTVWNISKRVCVNRKLIFCSSVINFMGDL